MAFIQRDDMVENLQASTSDYDQAFIATDAALSSPAGERFAVSS